MCFCCLHPRLHHLHFVSRAPARTNSFYLNYFLMNTNTNNSSREFSIGKQPLKTEDEEDLYEKSEKSINSSMLSFSVSGSLSSFESVQTSSKDGGVYSSLSRIGSDSALSGKTFMVHVPVEDQITRDSATEAQLARIRREIEEMEVKTLLNSDELKRRRSRKDLVKVPIEEGLPVALHSKETGKETEEVGVGVRGDTGTGTGTGKDTESVEPCENEQIDQQFGGTRIVDEDHKNYILMYDMLTGIRTSVSRCQAKPTRPLTPKDFHSTHKMAFDLTGNEETPSSRYDFKFKDYAPWVFRSLREQFSIDAADYLVRKRELMIDML